VLGKLLKSLRERPSSSVVFNQYRNAHTLDNLELFLDYLFEHRHNVLIIGEAPGYKGCRLTGIPFTSGSVIRASRHEIFKRIGDKITLLQFDTEATASVFWEFFGTNRLIPILWNAFPFHPRPEGNHDSNRKPTHIEIEEGKRYLLILHQIFCPKKLCSLGRVGQAILSELFPSNEIIYVRHPSRGGKRPFIKGMAQVCSHFAMGST
jgi:uracil-DNA glycosylase